MTQPTTTTTTPNTDQDSVVITPLRERNVEDVSDDDLHAYFFDDIASEDVSQAIDDYVDEKMRRAEENGTAEQGTAEGGRIDEEDLSKLSAEGDLESERLNRESERLDRESERMNRESERLDRVFEEFKGTRRRAQLLAEKTERDYQEYMSWCEQCSKDVNEIIESYRKMTEEMRDCGGYTTSSYFDAERWQLSIKLAEEAEEREQMNTKRSRDDTVEDYDEVEESQKRHKKARR